MFCLLTVVFAGCGNTSQENSSQKTEKQQEVYIVAAASMTDAIKEIGANYEKEHRCEIRTLSYTCYGRRNNWRKRQGELPACCPCRHRKS